MGRKRGKKKTKPIVGIYCEGKSEEQYFKMLSQKYGAGNIRTGQLHSKLKTKIKSLDESGEKLITAAKRKGEDDKVDKIYVVFDRDDKTSKDIQHCKKIADRDDITILFSSIDFEIWILMHFEQVTRLYTRKQLTNKLSTKKYFNQDYEKFKGSSYRPYLFDRIQIAEGNALRLEKINNDMENDDPFTNIHKYLREIFNVSIL